MTEEKSTPRKAWININVDSGAWAWVFMAVAVATCGWAPNCDDRHPMPGTELTGVDDE